jgi:carboxyl-terminal processing protease
MMVSTLAAQKHSSAKSSPSANMPAQSTSANTVVLSSSERMEIFKKVWKDINDYYYDPAFHGVNWQEVHQRYLPLVDGVKTEAELYGLMSRMTGELHDAHTRVWSPAAWAERQKPHLVTPGFAIDKLEGKTVITYVTHDSDGARAGIEPGMIVLTIDGQPIAEQMNEVRKAMNSSSTDRFTQTVVYNSVFARPPETALKMDLQRADGSTFEATITLHAVTTSVGAPSSVGVTSLILPSGFAYIDFDSFAPPAAKEFKDALVKSQSAPGLIIDLRFNEGGRVSELAAIAGNFYNKKTLLMRDTTRTGKPLSKLPLEVYIGKDNGQVYAGPVVILVNAWTGSAAEILAAGMQETGRAKVVGSLSCGCVLVIHKPRELKGGGELEISEALMLTAKGRKLEGEGVVPDKIVAAISDYQQKADPVIAAAEKALREMKREAGY